LNLCDFYSYKLIGKLTVFLKVQEVDSVQSGGQTDTSFNPTGRSSDTVTNTFMTQYTIPIDTNQLSKLPTRDDVGTWWMTNDQSMNLRSEHGWTIDGPAASAQIFVGTHTTRSTTDLLSKRYRLNSCHSLKSDGTRSAPRPGFSTVGTPCPLFIYCGTPLVN
jgi:hypothetical protein